MKTSRSLRTRRGSSFIEILIALAILAILMVGILQMFSLALLSNFGSEARTELLYKAQQVVENIRMAYALEKLGALGSPAARIAAGLPNPIEATTTPKYLPYRNTDASWAYWGPAGANIVDEENLPYRLSYTIEERDANFWLVTVTATPIDNPNLALTAPPITDAANPRRYRGPGSKLKIVTYSAQIEK